MRKVYFGDVSQKSVAFQNDLRGKGTELGENGTAEESDTKGNSMCEYPEDNRVRGEWAGIAAHEHVVQVYQDSDYFMSSLEQFVSEGLRGEDGVVVIATMAHLFVLEQRLRENPEFHFATLQARGRYVRLNAHEALWQFMVDGLPDEKLFEAFVDRIIGEVATGGRQVRAFGEMVAILWTQGNIQATKKLERIWHRVCQERGLALLCAYPDSIFTTEQSTEKTELLEMHSRVVVS